MGRTDTTASTIRNRNECPGHLCDGPCRNAKLDAFGKDGSGIHDKQPQHPKLDTNPQGKRNMGLTAATRQRTCEETNMTRTVGESTEPPKAAGNRGKGRVKGVPNKATASIRDIARQYTDEAVMALVAVLGDDSPAARVAAAKEILDRGYGKATTVIGGEDGGAIKMTHRIELVGAASVYSPD